MNGRRRAGSAASGPCWPPIEPPPTPWDFPPGTTDDPDGIVAVGADLAPGTVLAAYRRGIFPMHVRRRTLAWWSPDPRGVLPLEGLRVTRSLRRSCARYEVTVDTAFEQVLAACSDRRRPGAWINDDIREAYRELHVLGWVHSVEAWAPDGTLAGGLYGIGIGGLFAGESMFHHQVDASKVALVALVARLQAAGATLLDVQWATPHLQTLGVIELPRAAYLARVEAAVALPPKDAWH